MKNLTMDRQELIIISLMMILTHKLYLIRTIIFLLESLKFHFLNFMIKAHNINWKIKIFRLIIIINLNFNS